MAHTSIMRLQKCFAPELLKNPAASALHLLVKGTSGYNARPMILVRSCFCKPITARRPQHSIIAIVGQHKTPNAGLVVPARSCSTATSKPVIDPIPEVVTLKYISGLPNITVLLPSRNERCQFALRPISHTVGDFLQMLLLEDRGIDRAIISSQDGIRISAACSIEHLMDQNFILTINDKDYLVQVPVREKIHTEETTRLGDIQVLVAQLYEALHVGEHQLRRQRELQESLEKLTEQISPLEQKKLELDAKAHRRTEILTWCGLGFMSIQFGILARLTWWEYSWDIMEPVTYFVTYGTAMAGYAYYCITKQEYILEDVRDRQYLIAMHKKAKKQGLDLLKYNALRRQIVEIEEDLRRLRDPLYLHVPAAPKKIHAIEGGGSTEAAALVASEGPAAERLKELIRGLQEKLKRK